MLHGTMIFVRRRMVSQATLQVVLHANLRIVRGTCAVLLEERYCMGRTLVGGMPGRKALDRDRRNNKSQRIDLGQLAGATLAHRNVFVCALVFFISIAAVAPKTAIQSFRCHSNRFNIVCPSLVTAFGYSGRYVVSILSCDFMTRSRCTH